MSSETCGLPFPKDWLVVNTLNIVLIKFNLCIEHVLFTEQSFYVFDTCQIYRIPPLICNTVALFFSIGNIITGRSCETFKGTVCKKINEEDYCFCDSNLCNGAVYTIENTDDEELVEGSGTEIIRNDLVTETINSNGNIASVMKSVGILICCITWLI